MVAYVNAHKIAIANFETWDVPYQNLDHILDFRDLLDPNNYQYRWEINPKQILTEHGFLDCCQSIKFKFNCIIFNHIFNNYHILKKIYLLLKFFQTKIDFYTPNHIVQKDETPETTEIPPIVVASCLAISILYKHLKYPR